MNNVNLKKTDVFMNIDQIKEDLKKKRQFLVNNAGETGNTKKLAEAKVRKAEKMYLEALKSLECPETLVEFWEIKENDTDQMTIVKKKSEIVIAISDYNMTVTKTNIEFGKDLITNDKFEKVPLYVTDANLFYEAGIILKDLNGNTIKKGTPNVYVPVDSANGYWQWVSYYRHNLNALVKDDTPLVVENVWIKEFESLQDLARYKGVNNVLSRGFNGLEKAGNAALATQNDFFERVFQKAIELKANISVVTKYYNLGKTLKSKVWNSATLGVVVEKCLEYDLSIGDKIISTLKDKGFTDKVIKSRYMIDAIRKIANYIPQGHDSCIGFDEVIAALDSLSGEDINAICEITPNQVDDIYFRLRTQYCKNYKNKEDEHVA